MIIEIYFMRVACFLLATILIGCNSGNERGSISEVPLVPFSDLFHPPDTIRLDPTTIIGMIGVLDVNVGGDLLIVDHTARTTHLFSPSGDLKRSFAFDLASDCLPDEAEGFYPAVSRFIGDTRILTITDMSAAIVYNTEGECLGATRRFVSRAWNVCAHGDSIFALRERTDVLEAAAFIYSPSLTQIAEFSVYPQTEFELLNGFNRGILGHSMQCFADGPYFVYRESMDSTPIRMRSHVKYQPEFYVARPHDLPPIPDREVYEQEIKEYPNAVGVFALDDQTRMVFFLDLEDNWMLPDIEPYKLGGMLIASNVGHFSAQSALSPSTPLAAGNGYMYSAGGHEQLPDGELGNPLILRYRFIPPEHRGE